MTPDYTLYYWPLPFRGQFIRYVMAHASARWEDAPVDRLSALRGLPVGAQPLPFMAPPLLHDHAADLQVAQLPAILAYLGRKHALLPGEPARDALTMKVIGDANDVLEEITLNGGREMWTRAGWDTFTATRLPRWLQIFEETGRRHGLTGQGGYMLGTATPSLADLTTAALWFTMAEKLPMLRPLLEAHAPAILALSARIAHLPALSRLRAESDAMYGATLYCGGQIEASIRERLAED